MAPQHYRLYALNGRGSINLADWITAENDDEAIAKAPAIEHGALKAEVWCLNRLVATLNSQDLVD